MKFKASPKRNGNLIVEMEPGNTQLISNLNGPISELKKLLIPIDFSDCSKHALRYGVAFAKQFTSEITLVSVVQDNRTAFDYGRSEFNDEIEDRSKVYEKALNALAQEFLGKQKFKVEVRCGRPFQEIVGAAKESNSDLIIISTHGQNGAAQDQLGSTAERVIRYAPCPVLVVRQKEREFVPPVS